MRTECPEPNKEGCPYAPSCYADTDHIVPQRLATDALSSFYIKQLPENKQQLCRYEHDLKCKAGDNPLPSRDFMINAIRTAINRGDIFVAKHKLRRIFDASAAEVEWGRPVLSADPPNTSTM